MRGVKSGLRKVGVRAFDLWCERIHVRLTPDRVSRDIVRASPEARVGRRETSIERGLGPFGKRREPGAGRRRRDPARVALLLSPCSASREMRRPGDEAAGSEDGPRWARAGSEPEPFDVRRSDEHQHALHIVDLRHGARPPTPVRPGAVEEEP